MKLDHLAISGETLQEAQSYAEEALGVSLQSGGQHAVFHTHNALLGLEDGLYLEAIATNPSAPVPSRPRWFDLDRFHGKARLTNWICRSDDLGAELDRFPHDLGSPVQLQRGTLRWQMAVPDNGILPFDNRAPALIQWQTSDHPADRLIPSGIRLLRLVIRHPQGAALEAACSGGLADERVRFETGTNSMSALFQTPHGERVIEG